MNNGKKKMLPFHFHQYCHNGRKAEIIFWEVRQDGSMSFLHQPPSLSPSFPLPYRLPPSLSLSSFLSLSLFLHVFA